ncbi:MAG TPA: siderophore-interacting protein, partial [Myxococcota bacterium]
MPGLKALFGQTIAPLLCTSGQLVAVDALGPRFVRIVVKGPDIRAADFHPGDKVQALLADGEFRTWTPFAAVDDTVSFVVFAHGDASTPSARFAKTAKVGDTVSYFGPRGSLPIADVDGPAVLVGDETAFAVARTLRDHRAAAVPARDD